MNDLQTANETIGSRRTLLHRAEQDKRRLAAEVERLKNELREAYRELEVLEKV